MVAEHRHPHLERIGHAGAIDLGENIARQIGFDIGVLNPLKVMVGRGIAHHAADDVDGLIALQILSHFRRKEPRAQPVAEDRDAVEIALGRVPRQRHEDRLGAQRSRRPGELGVDRAEQAEQRRAHGIGHPRAHHLLVVVPAVASVAGEQLVAAVPRQRHGHVLARHRADAIGRHGGAVGERLVVEANQASTRSKASVSTRWVWCRVL